MKSEVYNMDCLEYMRTLPDKAFQLAIADPPYGGAGNDKLDGGGRFGQRFDRYKASISNWTAQAQRTECIAIGKHSTQLWGGGATMQQAEDLNDMKEKPG